MSFRALAADLPDVPLPDTDDRRTCQQCANLSPGGRCLVAWRGVRIGNAGRKYSPAPDVPRRCEGYAPEPVDADQRTGAERWPGLAEKRKTQ